ncbi:hypothetical protein PP175_08530 [Aneurinibacillus sp. Ricciae_BoGa-3]|uniref:hypothetical protein n=1 Tax=Aneurinibacillus sp. Ricciae_BoGa-3 TaxID=3022697 RepID=UPI00233F8B61|nr:hypothetical protein [Aneurinibacillus sp. Ricciae_BoGa-3]WCK55947.1 hypothetical protein PP175_08530 [Aneurinibacillus sp. Ricciae_BoGa-3]
MIEMKLLPDSIQSLYFDSLTRGRAQFSQHGGGYVGLISEEEFDGFLKENNLIVYRQSLKAYEDGEVVGHFMPAE